jgi:hypothetical protein
VTFLPGFPGDQGGQAPMPTFLRKGFGGLAPAFSSNDWAMGSMTRQ